MVESIYQIRYFPKLGLAITLLEAGELMDGALEFAVTANVERYPVMGAVYGVAVPKGAPRRTIDWSRYQEHASHAAAYYYCQTYPKMLTFMEPGELRIQVTGAALVVHRDAVLLSCTCMPVLSGTFQTLTHYRVGAGR